jgi:hypothetical protein
MTMPALVDGRARRDFLTPALAVTWIVAYFGARGVLEQTGFGTGVRVAAALAPIPFFAAFLIRLINAIRQLDELERQIHLEALAVAFPVGILLLMTLGLLQRAITLPFEDWSYGHVWPMMVLFYFIGLVVARRRYA